MSLPIVTFANESFTIPTITNNTNVYPGISDPALVLESKDSYNNLETQLTLFPGFMSLSPLALGQYSKSANQPLEAKFKTIYDTGLFQEGAYGLNLNLKTPRSTIPSGYAWKKITVVIENKLGSDANPVERTNACISIPISGDGKISLPRLNVISVIDGAQSNIVDNSASVITRSGSTYTYTLMLNNTQLTKNVTQQNLSISFGTGIDGYFTSQYGITYTDTQFDIISITGELEQLTTYQPANLISVVINNCYQPGNLFASFRKLYNPTNFIVDAVKDALVSFKATPIINDSRFASNFTWLASVIDTINEKTTTRDLVAINTGKLLESLGTVNVELSLYPVGMKIPVSAVLVAQTTTVIPRTNRTTTSTTTTNILNIASQTITDRPTTDDLSVLTLTRKIITTRNETKQYSNNDYKYTISYVDSNPTVFKKFDGTDTPTGLLLPGYISKDYSLIPYTRVKLEITINNVTTVATQQVGGVTTLSNLVSS